MKKIVYSLSLFAGLLASCSSEPITITEGESFEFDGQNITVNLTAASVWSNADEKTTIIAPEGKLYLKVDAKAEEDSYFLSLKDGESDIEEVDYLIARDYVDRSDDIMDPNTSDLYLVDASNAGYTIEIKSYSDELATLSVGELTDESAVELNPSMLEFVALFKDGARLSEAVLQFLPEGASFYDYATEVGSDVPLDPIVSGVEIDYVVDNNTYECSSEFGVDDMTVQWSGDKIEKVIFE